LWHFAVLFASVLGYLLMRPRRTAGRGGPVVVPQAVATVPMQNGLLSPAQRQGAQALINLVKLARSTKAK
jgi:hypothetical protein